MSVVAYCNGVLAADSAAYGGDYQPSPGAKCKVFKLADGRRVGITSGKLGQPERFLAYLEGRLPLEDAEKVSWDVRAMIIEADGTLYLAEDSVHMAGPIRPTFYAIGTGSKYALGAMACGASAAQAVQAAIRFDPHCGGEVRTV